MLDDISLRWANVHKSLVYHRHSSPSSETVNVIHFGPCSMAVLLDAISFYENITVHGPRAIAGIHLFSIQRDVGSIGT